MILDLLSSVTQWSQRSTDAQMVGGIVRCGSTTEWIRRKSLNTENKSTLDGLTPARSELVICKVGTKLGMGQKTQPKGCSVKRLHTESQAQRCAKINMCLKPKSQIQPLGGPCEPEKPTQSCSWAWRWCQMTWPRKKPKNLSPAGIGNRTGSWTLGHRLCNHIQDHRLKGRAGCNTQGLSLRSHLELSPGERGDKCPF